MTGLAILQATAATGATGAGRYLEWGVFSISLANALIILAMVVVFVLALVVPFGHRRDRPGPEGPAQATPDRTENGPRP